MMVVFRKIKTMICRFRQFGIINSCRIWVSPMIHFSSTERKTKYHEAILNYLQKRYGYIIEEFAMAKVPQNVLGQNSCIWMCWFQGEQFAPPLIQSCIKQVQKFKGNHPLVILNKENINRYCSLPAYIWEKLEKEKISYTHFSDILRNALLAQHGGIWLDASIFLTSNLDSWNLAYFTIKQQIPDDKRFVSGYKWTGFCQGGVQGNPVNSFVYRMFLEYHKKEKGLVDYYLIDYFMALGYRNIPAIKTLIDNVPYNNKELYYMKEKMLETFNKDEFEKIKQNTGIFKLKQRVFTDNENSLYTYLIKNES